MGNDLDKNNMINKISVPSEKILLKNGRYYCNIERKEYKLNPFIMKSLKKIHKFPCNYDDWDFSCEINDNKSNNNNVHNIIN